MIDDFRLWGSSRCRGIGEYSTETGLLTWMVHTIDNHNASLSEGGVLAVVVGDFHETPHQKRDNTDCTGLMRQSEARLRLARSPSPGEVARRAERGQRGRRRTA